jgi:cytochrome c553
MQFKRLTFWFVLIGLTLVTVSALALMTVQPASAQCGSQASSCKNCHEVQGQMPVNNDGSAWHKSHAFGDF